MTIDYCLESYDLIFEGKAADIDTYLPGENIMLFVILAALYFRFSVAILHFLFRNTMGIVADILTIICLFIALIISVGLAEYTEKKIKDKTKK